MGSQIPFLLSSTGRKEKKKCCPNQTDNGIKGMLFGGNKRFSSYWGWFQSGPIKPQHPHPLPLISRLFMDDCGNRTKADLHPLRHKSPDVTPPGRKCNVTCSLYGFQFAWKQVRMIYLKSLIRDAYPLIASSF
ncbi:hypothetical protein CEXT_511651 [Caerostris extrusa]|uniref:Uncharacterized protein n=1 Tax=Caerostris extrusa TaxID=172846 RepID=A0AAV4N5R4_CAEEX|nr:hypothetical protein CEXT_511651 [Caerostris extrusa]